MNTQLFVPKKIKVGYNERPDTYTKRLAYIIYYDNKGKLRKEASWNSWIDKGCDGKEYQYVDGRYTTVVNPDKVRGPLPIDNFDNVPTEGFVLNKKAGDYGTGWNHRQAKCRVYDPRNFEFEITIENLLFILEHATSTKGKGLEGKFIYGWDGKDLVLLPEDCPEYKSAVNFTSLQSEKIGVKDLVIGHIYQTKRQENLIYLGKYTYYPVEWLKDGNSKGLVEKKGYFFLPEDRSFSNLKILSGLTSLATKVSDEEIHDFAKVMDQLQRWKYFSKPKSLIDINSLIKERITDVFTKETNYHHYLKTLPYRQEGNYFIQYTISVEQETITTPREGGGWNYRQPTGKYIYTPTPSKAISIKNGSILQEDIYYRRVRDRVVVGELLGQKMSEEKLNSLEFYNLKIEFENGNTIDINKYF